MVNFGGKWPANEAQELLQRISHIRKHSLLLNVPPLPPQPQFQPGSHDTKLTSRLYPKELHL